MKKSFTLKELADLTKATASGNLEHLVINVDSLENANSQDVSFLANPRYLKLLPQTKAGIICIDAHTVPIEGKNFLITDNPSHTFQQIAELLLEKSSTAYQGIHPTAVIHPSCQLGKDITIGPYVAIDQDCSIGDRTVIAASVVIGTGVKIGSDSHIYSGVVIRENCQIGNHVIVQPNAVIGSCGFGYITNVKGQHEKMEQLGNVIIEDHVEIGACSTIDRARFKSTIIRMGTKIDNLVQIGHNVEIGEHNIIVSQTGIAGSSKTGKYVIFGGQAGVVGHVKITDHVMIASRGGVSQSIETSGKYGGGPAMPLSEYNRWQVQLRNINKQIQKIASLEEEVKTLKALLQNTSE